MKIWPKQWELYRKQLEAMGFNSYAEYLASDRWAATRQRYKASGKPWVCWVCGCTTRLQLHHQAYSHLGVERLSDLVVLCRPHHGEVHDYLDRFNLSVAFTPEALHAIKNCF